MPYLILALVCFGLVALLWAGTVWFQGYLYESVTAPDLYWRAPAAAAVLTAFLGLWCYLARQTPGSVPGLFQFSFRTTNLDKPYREFTAVSQGKESLYKMQTTLKGSRPVREYREAQTRTAWPPSARPEALVVTEEGEKVRFEARRSEAGTEYVDARGRVIGETDPGVYALFSMGLLLKNFFLYVGLLVVWFLCLWLLLRFQWAHALGLAAVLWLVGVLLLVPLLVEQAEKR